MSKVIPIPLPKKPGGRGGGQSPPVNDAPLNPLWWNIANNDKYPTPTPTGAA